MKILIFCPTYRLEPETFLSIFHQVNLETHRYDIMFTKDNSHDNDNENIVYNYEKMRRIALSEKYDKAWICESDIIPPRNALVKLLQIDAPIVSGFYLLRHGVPSPNVMEHDTVSMTWSKIQKHWNQVLEIAGGGMGCLLIDRSILERCEFMTDKKIAPDTPFMVWCQKNNIKQIADLSILCGHKKPDGRIIYPDYTRDYKLI